MSVSWKRWLTALALALGLPAVGAAELTWRPIATSAPPATVIATSGASASHVALGRPVPMASRAESAAATAPRRRVARGQAPDAAPDAALPTPPLGAQGVFLPGGPAARVSPITPVSAFPPPVTHHSVANPPDPPPPPDSASVIPPPSEVMPGVATDSSVAPSFWEKCKGWLTWGDTGSHTGRTAFQSDHAFPALASPITMPFYFEDPRALTELRPIFFYQGIPGSATAFGGGSALFFGTQGRVAFTERLSFVFSELGVVSLQPDRAVPPVQSGTGFGEIKLGPKYTFLRNTESGTVAAAGINFEVPVGSDKVMQHTGSLSLVPYVSIGQTFGRLPQGFGSLNVLGNLGYSASVDEKRSEFFYFNLHLDYNIANANTFYPLIELNWVHYTRAGNSTNLGTEGGDLFNFGSTTRQGNDLVRLAAGLRYRFSDNIWAGGAVEFPVTNEKGLADYRVIFDVIFRY